jgi:L-ribulose-5-phosphate 4-epimerase
LPPGKNIFVITGSGTGSLKKLSAEHYTRVTAYDLLKNTLTSAGPIKASSESLTHAAVYETLPLINTVLHIHHLALWEKLSA